jgi:hypothetical protein
VHLGGQAAAFLLHLGALQALAQPGGGDAGAELAAEQGEHRRAHRVEGDGARRRGRDHADHVAVAADERQHEPVARGGHERVGPEPAGRLSEDDRHPAGHGQAPRLGLVAQLLAPDDVGSRGR